MSQKVLKNDIDENVHFGGRNEKQRAKAESITR